MIYKDTEVYGVIYCLTSPSGKVYIGQTTNWGKRVSYYAGMHCQHQHKLYHALRKYGWPSFTAEIIDTAVDKTQLDLLEMLYINKFEAMDPTKGYNLCAGGSTRGELSAESKAKYRASVLGQVRPSITRSRNPASRAVICITTGTRYQCMQDAVEATGAHVSAICMCCTGKRKVGGRLSDGTLLKWAYA
jgi:group I intron endonuclease